MTGVQTRIAASIAAEAPGAARRVADHVGGVHPADVAVGHLLGEPGDRRVGLHAPKAADAGDVGVVGEDRLGGE